MNDYEKLLDRIHSEVEIIEGSLIEEIGHMGLCRNNRIYIDNSICNTEKKEILAEEYGHFKTSTGNILDMKSTENRKQELKARRYAIEMLVSLDDLIECGMSGCSNKYECADFLNITIDFLNQCIQHYRSKYGLIYYHKGYILHFNGDSIFIINSNFQN